MSEINEKPTRTRKKKDPLLLRVQIAARVKPGTKQYLVDLGEKNMGRAIDKAVDMLNVPIKT